MFSGYGWGRGDEKMKYDDIFQMVGNTPHIRVRARECPSARIYVKLEGCNPSGSLKDRAAVYMIHELLEAGTLRPSMKLLDASSGNMACAITFYGKLMGYSSTMVVNSKLTQGKRDFLKYYGATIEQIGDFTIEGNRYCQRLIEGDASGEYCFLDQLHNWANPKAHYSTTGPEIFSEFPDIKMVVGSLGSGGTMLGVGEFLKHKKPDVKVVVVESKSGTKIPGTGSFDDGDYVTPFIKEGISKKVFDHIVKISEASAIQRTIELRDQGIFAGLQAGGVLHATLSAVKEFNVEGDVVMISGDTGWKNLEKLLNI